MAWKQLTAVGLDNIEKMKKENAIRLAERGHDYSLLNSVLKKNDEVRLHSRFIFSMIDPDSLHYKGSLFLKLFLQQLPHPYQNWLNINEACVEKEKDQIDLLVHDGNQFIIIENKIDAVDQPHQITRYIQTIKSRFGLSNAEIEEKIIVLYLSARRKFPSNKSKSLIGFSLENDKIVWQGFESQSVEPPQKLKSFNLNLSTKIPFFHYSYYGKESALSLKKWIKKCIDSIDDERLKFAFLEYEQILNRLEPGLNWKNKMTFDEYVLAKENENEQSELYSLMVESRNALEKYVAKKLYKVLEEVFTSTVLSEKGEFKKITEASIYDWLIKKGAKDNYKNIGFVFEKQDKTYHFVFGVAYVYCLPVGEQYNQEKNCLGGAKIRPLVLEKGGLDLLIKAIQDCTKI